MFSLFSGAYDSYFAPTQLNLLIVGAGGVGKTALLERLKCTQFTRNKKIKKQQVSEYLQREVPGAFLPASARASSNDSQQKKSEPRRTPPQLQNPAKHKASRKENEAKKEEKSAAKSSSTFSFLKCPAPSRYANAQQADSESDEENANLEERQPPPNKPVQNGMGRVPETSQGSLQEIPLDSGDSPQKKTVKKPTVSSYEAPEDDQQCDVKPKSKMLPLHKIRPTIGMNLGKVDICGAQCHVWDLGGRMYDLWSRYYQDCDAVIFVWKVVEDVDNSQQQNKRDENDDDNDEDYPFVSAAEQLSLLEQVRKAIPDDVPFLIWGHWFPTVPRKNKLYTFDEPYSTGSVLPHYHNPFMNLYFGSAKSGAGVRQAMEWLIPIAARQKKIREKNTADSKDEEETAAATAGKN